MKGLDMSNIKYVVIGGDTLSIEKIKKKINS